MKGETRRSLIRWVDLEGEGPSEKGSRAAEGPDLELLKYPSPGWEPC